MDYGTKENRSYVGAVWNTMKYYEQFSGKIAGVRSEHFQESL